MSIQTVAKRTLVRVAADVAPPVDELQRQRVADFFNPALPDDLRKQARRDFYAQAVAEGRYIPSRTTIQQAPNNPEADEAPMNMVGEHQFYPRFANPDLRRAFDIASGRCYEYYPVAEALEVEGPAGKELRQGYRVDIFDLGQGGQGERVQVGTLRQRLVNRETGTVTEVPFPEKNFALAQMLNGAHGRGWLNSYFDQQQAAFRLSEAGRQHLRKVNTFHGKAMQTLDAAIREKATWIDRIIADHEAAKGKKALDLEAAYDEAVAELEDLKAQRDTRQRSYERRYAGLAF